MAKHPKRPNLWHETITLAACEELLKICQDWGEWPEDITAEQLARYAETNGIRIQQSGWIKPLCWIRMRSWSKASIASGPCARARTMKRSNVG